VRLRAILPATVQLFNVTLVLLKRMPPPDCPATLPEIVVLVAMSVVPLPM